MARAGGRKPAARGGRTAGKEIPLVDERRRCRRACGLRYGGHGASASGGALLVDIDLRLVVAGDDIVLELGQLAFVIQLLADITGDGTEDERADHDELLPRYLSVGLRVITGGSEMGSKEGAAVGIVGDGPGPLCGGRLTSHVS